MFFNAKTVLVSAAALLFVGQAMAIADDPVSACNCPFNCFHKAGSSCKFYHSHTRAVAQGICVESTGSLICIAS